MDQLEGRNVVLEALRRNKRRVVAIHLDERAQPDEKLNEIARLAKERGVRLSKVPRQMLDRRSETGTHNGIIADAEPLPEHSVASLVRELEARPGPFEPFLLAVDEAQYEHNVGAILRSSLGGGVDGVIVPVRRGKGLSPVVQRVAMGGAEEVPLVREGLSSALATLARAGFRIVGADQGGRPYWDVDLRGPLVVVLGGEDKGLSPALLKRCDEIATIPLAAGLDSLNVSVAAGVLVFERVRQMARTDT